jgi:curli biogenesis system outer membrane secretion channel CsgG
VLLSEDYIVKNHIDNRDKTIEEMQQEAQKDGAEYFLTGGVSEWRYKTGIDGEPAVSLRLVLYRTSDLKIIWSATGSDSDWGISSVGTVAQKLIQEMMEA